MLNKETRGGRREGSGRPKTSTKSFMVRCHPMVIDQVRLFAKTKSLEYEINK